jgi:hypothetical protein
MEDNKNSMNQLDEKLDEKTNRHREMTQERIMKRKRILKGVAIGAGIAIGVGAGVAGCSYVMELMNNYTVPTAPIPVGGAMGQWEEVPMPPETRNAKLNIACGEMRMANV